MKLSFNICFKKLRPSLVFLLPPLMEATGYGPEEEPHRTRAYGYVGLMAERTELDRLVG